MDLEVARADRGLDAVGLAARVRERARDLRLARAEEPEDAVLRRLRPRQHAPHRLGLERARPQPLQLAGGARAGRSRPSSRPRARAPARSRRARATPPRRGSSPACARRARSPRRDASGARRPAARSARSPSRGLRPRAADAGRARDELDRHVVVRRAEPAGDDDEVCPERLAERCLQLPLVVADDRDAHRRNAEVHELVGDERAVAVVALAADELAARYDEVATQRRCRGS